MEKLIYVLWKRDGEADEVFSQRLRGPLREALTALGAQRLQVNVTDGAVAAGQGLKQETLRPGPSGLVSFWLNSSHIRARYEAAIAEAVNRFAGYSVTESTVLPNSQPTADGARTEGFAQIALIAKPPRLTPEAFLDVWLNSHTAVGVETQSNFYYCQNIVNRVLTHGAPAWFAIVEERFPAGAMTDPQLFYDAAGDAPKYEANLARMMDSCARFIDFDRIDVIVTSAYRFGGWADLAGQPDYPR